MLAPRSKRMQYGLDLTRALLKKIECVANSHKASFVIFQADINDSTSERDEMYVLNGQYYLVSKRQFIANLNYVNDGFRTEVIPVTGDDWRVGPEDARANEQVMRELAKRTGKRDSSEGAQRRTFPMKKLQGLRYGR
jgi:hypothetical protein